jgi:hypothetical protein
MGQIQMPADGRALRDATRTSWVQIAHKATNAIIHPAVAKRFDIRQFLSLAFTSFAPRGASAGASREVLLNGPSSSIARWLSGARKSGRRTCRPESARRHQLGP